MQIYSVFDPQFIPYGRVAEFPQAHTDAVLAALRCTPMPQTGVGYVPEETSLQNLAAADAVRLHFFGGMPVQMGWCNGHNTRLNALEYHRDSEFNLGCEDFILLLARQQDIRDGHLDTASVKAFRVPAGVWVECYATTLHYAPCHCDAQAGFRVVVALPRGTNLPCPQLEAATPEDQLLFACNKWLLAHPESDEAKNGAYIGLLGTNIDITTQE